MEWVCNRSHRCLYLYYLRSLEEANAVSTELYFTNPDTKASVRQNNEQAVDHFLKAMSDGEPREDDRMKSGILGALWGIAAAYGEGDDPKPKTVLVLTDGIWESMNESGVDTLIQTYITLFHPQAAQISHHSSGPRALTFQFIRFGDDPVGIERLRRLDDDLKKNDLP